MMRFSSALVELDIELETKRMLTSNIYKAGQKALSSMQSIRVDTHIIVFR